MQNKPVHLQNPWINISSGEKFNTGYYYRLLVAAEVNIIIINKRLQYY
jgi:hypothetical protein